MKKVLVVFLLLIIKNGVSQTTDYSNIKSWAAHEMFTDKADALPKKLRKQKNNVKVANVFFIHPTTYTEPGAYKNFWNATLTDMDINKQTDETTIQFQASCFNEQSNVYAPRYRQAHINAFYNNTIEGKAALDTAYIDIKNAFEYFLNNLNKNKPIIIAAHSQGTVHAARLLKDYFENKPLMQKLVAAYLIGMPIKKNYFDECKPCYDASETGCFVSWRTFLKGNQEKYIELEEPQSVYVTNPLSWKMDTINVVRKNNKGAVLLKFNSIWKKVCNAQVHNNILWINKPKFPLSFLVKNNRTNYHIGDINLFYMNIRENVKLRLSTYLKKEVVK